MLRDLDVRADYTWVWLVYHMTASLQVKGSYIEYSKRRSGSRRSQDMQTALELWHESLKLADVKENEIELGA